METVLNEILTRAQRWDAVMLIDAADVYIKRRGDNITMNAVASVFLRVLEYFNGLLFCCSTRNVSALYRRRAKWKTISEFITWNLRWIAGYRGNDHLI